MANTALGSGPTRRRCVCARRSAMQSIFEPLMPQNRARVIWPMDMTAAPGYKIPHGLHDIRRCLMRAVDVIRKKRNGRALTADEIRAFVRGAGDGAWMPYQVSALLMAIVLRGMDSVETAALTAAMVQSG